jgi:predicted phosphodiesterase
MIVRYALISDVHANLPALEAVLADIEARPDVGAIHHLGDLVGYGPWPNEVVALLRAREITGVAGNYDSTVATDYAHCGCRYEDPRQEALAHRSYAWTRAHVSPDAKRWLAALPFRLDLRPLGGHRSGPRLILIHGNAVLNTVYWTEDRPDSFCRTMAAHLSAKAGDVVAFGHTHKPWQRTVEGVHYVNAGSVGRPKDGDWRAGYALVDVEEHGAAVTFVRVAYDLVRASDAIRASGLPPEFAAILETGGHLRPAVEPLSAAATGPLLAAPAEP